MNKVYRMAVCGSLLGILLGGQAVSAATYYVATNGNDAQTCVSAQTIAAPKRTIASGVACLNPGDTLYIRAGIWTEQIDLTSKTGVSGQYITIAGYPGETVTLRYTDGANLYGPIKARGIPAYLIFDNLVLDGVNNGNGSGWQIRDGNHDFILRNLEIKNFRYNGLYISANNVSIINCTIHDQVSESGAAGERWYGIYFHDGANGLIEGNRIHNNPGGGIHAYPGTISNLIIRGNSVHHNNTLSTSNVGGILVFEGSSTPISGVQIYNNLVYNNSTGGSSGTSEGIRVSNGPDATKVWHNTVYGNKGWGINVQAGTSPPTSTVIQNNIVFSNSLGEIVDAGIGSTIDHNLTSDPRFMNAAALDFTLQPSSPATNSGLTLSQIKTDFRNTPRPQGGAYDIGAYEVGGGSDATPPNPPQLVSVK